MYRRLLQPAFLSLIILATVVASAASPELTQPVWDAEYNELAGQIQRLDKWKGPSRERIEAETLDRQAMVWPEDNGPLDVVLRRTGSLIVYFKNQGRLDAAIVRDFTDQLEKLNAAADRANVKQRRNLFNDVCRLRRKAALANPLLDFDDVLCMLEQPGDARIIEQARACWGGHARGGGPMVIRNFKSEATVEKLLEGVAVTSGPFEGKELSGYFSGLELSYNAKQVLFAATTDSDVWRIFRFHRADKTLEQLTDGPWDDFDPCLLPSGRIVFTSTRRGGIGRCLLVPQALTYTLHSMNPDGSDVVTLSYHETNEWQPSVSHDGMLVYTRWDYLDRWWASAHHLWMSFPDGRDPRNFHGNYPLPWSAFPDDQEIGPEQYGQNRLDSGRANRPDVEISFRAIPNSGKYTATAVGHHQGFSGSLVMVDPRVPDDGKMAQVKRITPEYLFPEVEPNSPHAYGTAWPLSEDFFLCNFNRGLYLLDRFGNRVVIYDPLAGPYRVRDPFPLRERKAPPAIPVKTWQGERSSLAGHRRATIKVMNCYVSDMPLPEGTKVKWMRIIQAIPQMRTQIDGNVIKYMSAFDESIGRMPLGVVPVEDDGSVYCEAPVGKTLYFQLLDEKGMAVHSMRSATYVHAGEQLSCVGCHESKWDTSPPMHARKAFQRPPSKIVPEVDSGAIPFNFHKLLKQPVFDRKCVPCHLQHPKAPDMTYGSLAKNHLAFGLPGEIGMRMIGIGASRTTPGRVGAHASGIMKSLTTKDYHKDLDMSDDDWRRLTLWLDLNSNELGWIGDDIRLIEAQRRGEDVWPPIDVDRANPTGVENGFKIGSSKGGY